MPNNYLSVLYQHIIQVENKNVGLKVEGHKHTIAPQSKKCGGGGGGTCPPPPLPTPVRTSSRIGIGCRHCYPMWLIRP